MEPAFLHQAMGFSIIFRFHAASCATVTEIPSNGCLEESLLVGFHQVLPVSGSHVGFLEEFFVVPSISDWGKPRKLGEAAGPSRGVGRRGGGATREDQGWMLPRGVHAMRTGSMRNGATCSG